LSHASDEYPLPVFASSPHLVSFTSPRNRLKFNNFAVLGLGRNTSRHGQLIARVLSRDLICPKLAVLDRSGDGCPQSYPQAFNPPLSDIGEFVMTPIKLNKFLSDTGAKPEAVAELNLTEMGLYHAAPVENGQQILAMRYDPKSGTLIPSA
jgi:hypothetical protein